MKKSRICLIVFNIAILICCVCLFHKATDVLERKTSRESVDAFLQSDTNKDILFIGTSQVPADVLPIKLWEHYGYSSYTLYAAKDGIRRDLGMLRMGLAYTDPKLVVINTDRYWRENAEEDQVAGYHGFLDAFPLTREKVRAVCDIYESRETRAELLFPFLIYHNRWKELQESDFYVNDSSFVRIGGRDASQIAVYDKISPDEKEVPEGNGQDVLREMIEECQARGIEVMLVTLPLEADAEQQRYFNSLDDLSAEYGVPHLNLLYADFLNSDTDYSDGAHLNISGAGKMTAYLGNYIQQNYDIPCRYDDEKYMEEWGNAFQTYLEEKRQLIRQEEDLKKLLLMCRDEDLNCAIYVSGSSSCHADETTDALIRNIIPMERYDEAENAGQNYFVTVDYGNGEIHEYISPEEVVVDTSFGKLSFRLNEEDKPVLQAGDEAENLFAHDGRADICIAVFDRWTGELICAKCFKTDRVLEAIPRTVEKEQS